MKPPPYTPEKFVKSTWFARPLRANILPHWPALVAHAPVSSNAFSSCSDSRTEPAVIAVARTRFRSTIIGFFLEPLSVTAQHEENTSLTGGARWMLDLDQRSRAQRGSGSCAERRRTASRRHRSAAVLPLTGKNRWSPSYLTPSRERRKPLARASFWQTK